MSEENHMKIWESLEKTDPAYVKEVTGKGYKMSAINSNYVIKQLTKLFGPCGIGWGVNIHDESYDWGHGDSKESGLRTVVHKVRIGFWYYLDGNKSEEIPAYGQTFFVRNATKGWITDEDAAKKSLTDAITKASSMIGMSADIFSGQWDSNKYVTSEQDDVPFGEAKKLFKGKEVSQKEAYSKPGKVPGKPTGMGDRGNPISTAQGKRLFAIAMSAKVPIDDLKAFLKEHYGVDGIDCIGWKDYERVCEIVANEWEAVAGRAGPDEGDGPDIPF